MTAVQRRRMKRRRRFVRNLCRAFAGITLTSIRLPRISAYNIDQAMKNCEIIGIVFVTFLMVQLSNPSVLGKIGVVVSATAFVVLLMLIKYSDYQDENLFISTRQRE